MGQVLNPNSHRLGLTKFWDTNWALSSGSLTNSYSFSSSQSIFIFNAIKKLFNSVVNSYFVKGAILTGYKNFVYWRKNIFLLYFRSATPSKIKIVLRYLLANIIEEQTKKKRLLSSASRGAKVVITTMANKKSRDTLYSLRTDQGTRKSNNLFLFNTATLSNFKPNSNIVDLNSYTWAMLSRHISTQRFFKKMFHVYIVSTQGVYMYFTLLLLKYSFVVYWLSLIRKAFIAFSQRLFVTSNYITEVGVLLLPSSILTANFIAKYIAIRLLQRFPLNRIISKIVRQMTTAKNVAFIRGFKIACNGRFERRGRATHLWKTLGKIPRSNPNINVEYAIMLPVLVNSICSVRVWITKNSAWEKLYLL